jgi:UDP-glucose:(heptosyl)LPS alpha-1,3-glucosyltransferase
VLALTPVRFATHYQLHGGIATCAFAAERASIASPIRRTLFNPALRLNRRRQRLLRDEAEVLSGAAVLMAFSQAVASELIERRGVAPERVTISRPGVPLRRFHPLAATTREGSEGSLRLVFAAHNFALKGLRQALQAVARATRTGVNVSLSVAGSGQAASYRRLAATLNISQRVRFVGSLSQDALAELYRASDALLHPTFFDPFPRVAIEALASACPVITTEACGAAEILTAGEDGLVVPHATHIDALADAIATLASGSTLKRMRHAAADTGQRFDEVAHFRATTNWLFEHQ